MKKRINNIILLLAMFLVFVLVMGATSAANIDTDCSEISASNDDEIVCLEDNLNELSTTSNYSELSNEIGSGGNIKLKYDYYIYDSGSTICITDSDSVVDGNGAVIDMVGSNISAFSVSASRVTIKNLTIKNADCYSNSGAILWDGNDGTVTDCNFINNAASSGAGAICFNSAVSCRVINCNFINNTDVGNGTNDVYGYGGAVCFNSTTNCAVINCNFTNNTVRSIGNNRVYAYGGAIYSNGTNSSVINCNFINNVARYISDSFYLYSQGGAIYSSGAHCTVSNCDFINNTVAYTTRYAFNFHNDGGAIYFGSTIDSSIINCNFANNSAINGGAIYWSSDVSNGTVSSCIFNNNSANDGGAIYLDCANSNVNDCIFTNNSVTNGGGAIYGSSYAANDTVVDCIFTNNFANRHYGGAIYWNGVNYTVVDCIFSNNFARSASAIFCSGADGTVNNCNFSYNTANSTEVNGGGIIRWTGFNGTVSDCIFTNNAFYSANVNGGAGAIYWNAANGTVTNSDFTNNYAGMYGGAIYWWGDNGMVSSCNFTNNSGYSGGVIEWISGDDGLVVDCIFSNNSARYDGGSIHWSSYADNGNIIGCIFYNNSANSGGAICELGVNGTVIDCIFDNNSASDGGAIYFTSNIANFSIAGCNFVNNCGNYRNIYLKNNPTLGITDNKFLDTVIILADEDYYCGEDFTVYGVVDAGLNYAIDNFKIQINDTLLHNFTFNVTESGEFGFDVKEGVLTVGDYNITADNDEYYNEYALISPATFTVSKHDLPFTVDEVDSVTYPDDVYVNITADVGGTFTVTIGNKSNKTHIDSGETRTIIISGVSAGIEQVVTVDGVPDDEENYTAATDISRNVTVNKASLDMLVSVESPVVYPDGVVVTVNAPVAGLYVVVINGISNTTHVNASGVVDIIVNGLAANITPYNIGVAGVPDDDNYDNMINDTLSVKVNKKLDVNISAVDNGEGNVSVVVEAPYDYVGDITVKAKGSDYHVVNGTCIVPGVAGDVIIVDFADDSIYSGMNISVVVIKSNSTVVINDIRRGVYSAYDAVAYFTDEYGKSLVDAHVEFYVDGLKYDAVTDDKGAAYLNSSLPLINNSETTYNVTAVNPRTGENMTAVSTIVPRLIVVSGDLTADYLENPPYLVQAIGDDGNPVAGGEIVEIVFAMKTYYITTNATGYAVRTIGLAPGQYGVYAKYQGDRTDQTVFIVKQVLKATSGTLKKTAKSYTLKVTLKHTNGKAISGKVVELTFNGKTYSAKTNSKGVASYNIKSSVIKKLKAGKTYALKARYVNDVVKGKIKVVEK